jgi:hypothetical protein
VAMALPEQGQPSAMRWHRSHPGAGGDEQHEAQKRDLAQRQRPCRA